VGAWAGADSAASGQTLVAAGWARRTPAPTTISRRPLRRLPAPGRLGYQRRSCFERRFPLLFLTLFEIVGYLISVIVMLVIMQFVLSLLISFNVVNIHNDFVNAIWKAVNALLEPILRPIRRILPNTGAIDFSPLVLIVGLEILRIILKNLAMASVSGAL